MNGSRANGSTNDNEPLLRAPSLASCALIGTAASSASDESGTLPSGARYVLTQLWPGAAVPIMLTATNTQ